MDKNKFIAALTQIAAEKNLDEDVVLDAVKQAIHTAYQRDFGNDEQEIEVVLRDDVNFVSILQIKEVVEKVENSNFEISLEESKKIKSNVEIGDEIKIDVTPIEYGRIAAQSAKQVVIQKLQELEKQVLFTKFRTREDTIINGIVGRIEGNHVFIEVEKNNILLHPSEQIPNEKYFTGKRLKLYLEKVHQTQRGPQLKISRKNNRLLELLIAQEIPEVEHGEVEIMSCKRDPGFRSKVVVRSLDEKIDPVGACIGQRGARITPIIEALSNERIDIIEWSDNPAVLITKALQPAKVQNVIIVVPETIKDENTGKIIKKRAAIFVDDNERSIAIGKKGQNIKLASHITGFELDMYNTDEFEPFMKKLKELSGESENQDNKEAVKETEEVVEQNTEE